MTRTLARLRLLDMFCGAGGCAMGYSRAGFDVVGVDNRPQPHFPFQFVQCDALEFCAEQGHEYDVIHASPPCQQYSVTRCINGKTYPDLLPETRRVLASTGRPYLIENVVGARMPHAVTLCGIMFGLHVYRHRLFESSEWLSVPPHMRHMETTGAHRCYSGYRINSPMVCVAGHNFNLIKAAKAMGIDWMNRNELAQAIPPAYTEFIGRQLMERLE